MKCSVHTDREAVGVCSNCGKGACEECVRTTDDILICNKCRVSRLKDKVSDRLSYLDSQLCNTGCAMTGGVLFIIAVAIGIGMSIHFENESQERRKPKVLLDESGRPVSGLITWTEHGSNAKLGDEEMAMICLGVVAFFGL